MARCLSEEAENDDTASQASAAVSVALWGSDLAPFAQQQMMQVQPVQAVEKASGSGSRVNKDAESLLRYGLPIQNKEVCLYADAVSVR